MLNNIFSWAIRNFLCCLWYLKVVPFLFFSSFFLFKNSKNWRLNRSSHKCSCLAHPPLLVVSSGIFREFFRRNLKRFLLIFGQFSMWKINFKKIFGNLKKKISEKFFQNFFLQISGKTEIDNFQLPFFFSDFLDSESLKFWILPPKTFPSESPSPERLLFPNNTRAFMSHVLLPSSPSPSNIYSVSPSSTHHLCHVISPVVVVVVFYSLRASFPFSLMNLRLSCFFTASHRP